MGIILSEMEGCYKGVFPRYIEVCWGVCRCIYRFLEVYRGVKVYIEMYRGV